MAKGEGIYEFINTYLVISSLKLLPAELVDNEGCSQAGEEEDRPHHHAAHVGRKLCAYSMVFI